MKTILIFLLILTALSSNAQALIVDSATGSKIQGAKYLKAINKYILKADSVTFRKAHKKAKFTKEKVQQVLPLYDSNIPIEYYFTNANDNYILSNNNAYIKRNLGYTGKGIKVMVLDTGVDTVQVPIPHFFDNNKVWVGTAIDINDFVLKWNLVRGALPSIEIFDNKIITDSSSLVTKLYGDYIMLYVLPDDITEQPMLDEEGNYIFNSETILY